MKKPKNEYSIQTVTNALHVLEAFRGEGELGVTELSRRLALHKNNVFRLLATLEQGRYIEQCSDSDRYRLGVACLELGQSYARSQSLVVRARPVLEELSSRFGESAHLGVMGDYEVVHVDGQAADRLLGTATRVGCRLPLHCAALGKVLLGCGGEAVREAYDRVAAERGMEARTPATIVDRHKFFEHLRSVTVQRFAVDVEESEAGLCCAAAPVFDERGAVVAALSVSGPACRLDEERLLREIVPGVVLAAEGLSRALGYAS